MKKHFLDTKNLVNYKFLAGLLLFSFLTGHVAAAGELGLYARLYKNQSETTTTVAEGVLLADFGEPETASLTIEPNEQEQVLRLFDKQFQAIMPAAAVQQAGSLQVHRSLGAVNLPWSLKRLSPIYDLAFLPSAAYNSEQYYIVQLSYDEPNNDHKQIYYEEQGSWKPLPSTDYPGELYVQAVITKPAARLAVFSHPGVLTVGQASWYSYKGGDFAASPDFPKNSIVRVINTANGKFVDVTINDWGPERDKFPNRAVDLDKLAFAKIASLGAGVIDVVLQPLYIAPDSQGQVLGVKESGLANEPKLTAWSSVIMDGAGQLLLNKNGSQTTPLASLTKLVSIYVFLSLNPNLSDVVSYQYADEKISNEYCNPWESAKVSLQEGDQLLVKDLLYSALVGSANNAVESLVRSSGLPRKDFIAKMNSQVASWGAKQTHFVEPTGLSVDNVSTAQDYAIILKEVLRHDLLASASVTPEYTFSTLNTQKEHKLRNTNKLLASQPAIAGSKTGYLNEAGYCLATKVKKDDKEFYIVSLGAESRAVSFSEMSDLITYSLNNL